MYIKTIAILILLIISIFLGYFLFFERREEPTFDSKTSPNFKNIKHFEGDYKHHRLIVNPSFTSLEYKGKTFYKDYDHVYKNCEEILDLKYHPFYFVKTPILKNNIKLEHNIPRIIWQTSFVEPEENTDNFIATQTFKSQNGWEYKFVSDKDAIKFLKENFDKNVFRAFEVLVPGAYKADLLRACLLYIYGGVYADIKLHLHYDLDSFLTNDLVLVKEKDGFEGIWNGFMASIPKHEYFKNVINSIVDNVINKFYGKSTLDLSGPQLYGKVYKNMFNVKPLNLNFYTLKGDDKNYISQYKNQEMFISWKKKLRKWYERGYAYYWNTGQVYNLKLHKKYFNTFSGNLSYFKKSENSLNFLWSKGLESKTRYMLKSTESNNNDIDINNDIIWVRMGSKKSDIEYFSTILHKLKSYKTLVTSDGDLNIPSGLKKSVVDKILNCKYIQFWYTQNYDGSITHPKLKPYPIGIDLHTLRTSGISLPVIKINKLLEIRNNNKTKINKVFCDLHLSTSHLPKKNERKRVYEILKNKNIVEFLNRKVSQFDIWENYAKYDFTISTHGNGLDCHRTWEIILLGGTVITKTSSLDPLYKNLPVIIVKDWDECTEENLKLWKNIKFDKSNEFIYKAFTYDYWLK